jgi:CubicO group peptidase (beta-lactamase class C family)
MRAVTPRPGLLCVLALLLLAPLRAAGQGAGLVPLPSQPPGLAFPTREWEHAAPGTGGTDVDALERALDEAFRERDPARPVRTRAVVLVHGGRVVVERYAPGFSAGTRLLGWSMTKSVLNALLGIAVREGRLALDAPADVPAWRSPGDPRHAISLLELLRMSSGLQWNESYGASPYESDVISMLYGTGHRDMAAFAATARLIDPPGSAFYYSSGTSLLLSEVLRRALGGSDAAYHEFPRRELFAPIGMRSALLESDASGTFVASSYSWATALDWARFGYLYLRDGAWEGRRILPEGWVDLTRTPAPASANGEYGAHFWLNAGPRDPTRPPPIPGAPRDLFYASGYQGQLVAIVPSRDLVVVRLGLTPDDGRFDLEGWLARTIAAFPARSGP